MTAPTEPEIRAIIEREAEANPNDRPFRKLEEAAIEMSGLIDFRAPEDEEFGALGDAIWTDLRHSEEARLHQLVGGAVERAQVRARAVIIDELTVAALAFAAEFPDAPRARAEVSA